MTYTSHIFLTIIYLQSYLKMIDVHDGPLGDRVAEEQLYEDLVKRAIHLLVCLDVCEERWAKPYMGFDHATLRDKHRLQKCEGWC